MPYIEGYKRVSLEPSVTAGSSGELNFVITQVIKDYLRFNGLDYDSINDVLGALEGAKLEFYRRVAVPYENGKMSENGDVY
jgi:hypothetical protein